jgi:hypothetical protein
MSREQMIQKILDLSIRLCESFDSPSVVPGLSRLQATEQALRGHCDDVLKMILTTLDW